jgi:hypothetical protein
VHNTYFIFIFNASFVLHSFVYLYVGEIFKFSDSVGLRLCTDTPLTNFMLSWSYNQIKDDDVENDESMRSGIWNCLSFRCQRLKNFISRTFQFDLLKTDLEVEMMGGLIQFLSTMYCLPVIPSQMATAGYDRHFTFASISLCIAVSSILFSYCSNLPFIIAPPTSISIYLVAAQLDLGLSRTESNTAVVYSGMALLIVGLVKPISQLVSKVMTSFTTRSHAQFLLIYSIS